MKIVNLVGYSGSGKTTLMEKLIAHFSAKGYKVSAVKNTHHGIDLDRPGKDTFRFREAGAGQVIIRTGERWALMSETKNAPLETMLAALAPCDYVFVEGFKSEDAPALRMEVWRSGVKEAQPLYLGDSSIRAVITTDKIEGAEIPVLDLNSPEAAADWIENYFLRSER